ncbi:Dehydration-responsive element-binding protein 1D [Heracleum sosnowskyi]|uniref:Dehydration-responsive element-binding protein 1D n=1 Tax=Heracleum sosnowskyi TaxID=360622 RepID=A0AAD8IVM5_9APIA|nr:Dehydration-responsive element-binding protein 1D [Heracleum sosnowskyi]
MDQLNTNQDLSEYPSPSSVQSPESASTTERTSKSKDVDPNSYDVLLASSTPKKRSGRIKFKETRHPVYRGIRRRNSGKWVCEVREPINNSRIWLGTYPTAEMAARANDVAAIALRGRNACLNFEDSVWRLPVPDSSDVKDIQKAAAKAAEAFRPPKNEGTSGENTTSSLVLQEDEMFDMDEDEIFGMPELINSMAEGMLISPPQYVQSDGCCEDDDLDDATNLSLWSYSF